MGRLTCFEFSAAEDQSKIQVHRQQNQCAGVDEVHALREVDCDNITLENASIPAWAQKAIEVDGGHGIFLSHITRVHRNGQMERGVVAALAEAVVAVTGGTFEFACFAETHHVAFATALAATQHTKGKSLIVASISRTEEDTVFAWHAEGRTFLLARRQRHERNRSILPVLDLPNRNATAEFDGRGAHQLTFVVLQGQV